jgi:hypothetical protein
MSTPRCFFAATSLPDGRVLVEGGCNKGDCGTVTKSAEVFDSRTHTWTVTGSLATGRDYHTAHPVGERQSPGRRWLYRSGREQQCRDL